MPDLRDWLENAEVRYRRIFRSLQPAPIGALMPVALQVFAYHETHDPTRIPVICVGSNYSQGEGQVGEGCGANLSQWWNNYLKMRAVFGEGVAEWKRAWVLHRWSSPQFPVLPTGDEAFFVMTNLCPWITKSSWTELEQESVDELLNASRLGGEYRHLEELLACLLQQEREFVLLGHGIDGNIIAPLLDFLTGRYRWLLYANLTYPHTPSRWDDQRARFVF
jgi:hypothetical protein